MKKVAERMSEKMNSPLEVCASSGLLTLLACSEQHGSLNKRFEKRDYIWLHPHPPSYTILVSGPRGKIGINVKNSHLSFSKHSFALLQAYGSMSSRFPARSLRSSAVNIRGQLCSWAT